MRALVQRIRSGHVEVDGQVIGKAGPGLLVLVCAMQNDGPETAHQLAKKIAKLRIFTDDNAKMNRSVLDTGGDVLVVSQFTLAADARRGNRPGFSAAASPDQAKALYETFAAEFSNFGVPVQTGRFGADMQVHLINDGPVTIWLDTDDW